MVSRVQCGWCEKDFPITEEGQKEADKHATTCPEKETQLRKMHEEIQQEQLNLKKLKGFPSHS